jgi:hypothetical protein
LLPSNTLNDYLSIEPFAIFIEDVIIAVMLKRTETGFTFDEKGTHLQKHIFIYPGRGVYVPSEDSWVRNDDELLLPARLYSYAGGSILLPWICKDDNWKVDIGISITSGGVVADPSLIAGEPKEKIRLINHVGNSILVITWPENNQNTFYIFDSQKRQLTTSLHPWSLGAFPPQPFCREIEGPVLNSSGNIELAIVKGNKITTSISIAIPADENEPPMLMALSM